MRAIDEFLNGVPNKTLFHYTTSTGLLGIFETGKIWASSAYHLNDSKEFHYAAEVLTNRIQARKQQVEHSLDGAYDMLLNDMPFLTAQVQVFVASFSEDGDLLSQWLAYSGEGSGYAIGFEPSHFQSAKEDGFTLVRCIYDQSEQFDLAESIIDILIEQIRKGYPADDDNRASFQKALTAMAALKHSGFQQEREWRLVKTHLIGLSLSNDVKFRPGRNGIVPYLLTSLTGNDVGLIPDAINIGPGDDNAAQLAVITLLDSLGLMTLNKTPVRVARSKTPYRP